MRGRKSKPTARKQLEGNPGKRRLNQDEPKPQAVIPALPAFLSREAKSFWKKLTPELERIGLLTIVDGEALAAACQSYARWVQAEREITRHGILIDSPIISKKTGEVVGSMLKKNPACNAAHNSLTQMRAFFALFGMDPSSRARLNVDESRTDDPLEQLLQRKANRAKDRVQ